MATPAADYEAALSLIDEAHAQDPTIAVVNGRDIPYELHYAQRCTYWLELRAPNASPVLKIAIRAQHFRRYFTPLPPAPKTPQNPKTDKPTAGRSPAPPTP
jgi:hypothetical protein